MADSHLVFKLSRIKSRCQTMKVKSDEKMADITALLHSSVIAPAYPLLSLFHCLELASVLRDSWLQQRT